MAPGDPTAMHGLGGMGTATTPPGQGALGLGMTGPQSTMRNLLSGGSPAFPRGQLGGRQRILHGGQGNHTCPDWLASFGYIFDNGLDEMPYCSSFHAHLLAE